MMMDATKKKTTSTTTTPSTKTTKMDILLSSTRRNSSAAASTVDGESVDKRKAFTPNTTPTHKALKTNIFNWFKSATTTTTASNCGLNKRENHLSEPPQWMRPRTSSPDAISFREFRGVQSLRHLWNKRINANAEAVRLCNSNNKGKLTKSISCLVNTPNDNEANNNNITLNEVNENFNDFQRTRPNRAQSLHDCRVFDVDNNNVNNNGNTDSSEIDTLHRVKDNFYKYKTAEQASIHLAREARARAKTKNATCGNNTSNHNNHNNNNDSSNIYFPAFTKCESGASHINWLKRHDINININSNNNSAKRTTEVEKCSSTESRELQGDVTIMAMKDKKSATTTTTTTDSSLSEMNDVISAPTNTNSSFVDATLKALNANNNNENNNNITTDEAEMERKMFNQSAASSDTDTLTAPNTPKHCISPAALIEQKRSATNRSAHTSCGNKRSANSSPSSNSSRRNTPRRSASNISNSSACARKYSFKTHTRNFVTPRKMHNHRDGAAATSNNNATTSVGNGGSVVAKLTQQFNEIIQKDRSLLKELKRKNNVILTRGCHVYKVIDTKTNSNDSPAISRTSSRSSRDLKASPIHTTTTRETTTVAATPTTTTYASVVKKTIKKFEQHSDKPAIPPKSSLLLQQKAQMQRKNNEKRDSKNVNHNHQESEVESNRNSIAKRNSLNLALAAQQENLQDSTDTPTSVTLKKAASHTILLAPPSLEVVKEEARTPLENDEKKSSFVAANEYITSKEAASVEVQSNELNFMSHEHQEERATNLEAESTKIVDNATGISNKQVELQNPIPEVSNIIIEDETTKTTTHSIVSNINEKTLKSINKNLETTENRLENTSTRQRYRKKCAKFYEKFRLFSSPFDNGTNNGKVLSITASSLQTDSPQEPLQHERIEQAESKLLDALEACNEKLKDIANSASKDLPAPTEVIISNDDFEKRVLPNSSFVHHACTKRVSNNQLLLPQAINVTLVNSIEGEQMIMEQKELQTKLLSSNEIKHMERETTSDRLQTANATDNHNDETIYESISNESNETVLQKTELDSMPPKSFLYKLITKSETTDDIYQTVEEAKQQQQQPQQTTSKRNSISSLNDYESIAGSCEQSTEALLSKLSTVTTIVAEKSADDGYELCEPPAEETHATLALTQSPMVRNTTDELPELPKPKRRLPKSPMPKKRSTKASTTMAAATTVATTPVPIVPLIPDIDEQHYYADDENIYDTIKGSHCYESLNANNNRAQKTAIGKNGFENAADSVSLSSNCYETITHYRRVVLSSSSGGHTTGSSSGSTLTISSDHKTNSLYEAPLSTALLFSRSSDATLRASICRDSSSNESVDVSAENCHNEAITQYIACTVSGDPPNVSHENVNVSNESGISHAISSDNSDEWIDISESEAEDREKRQFIVVRERQKVHRSPDWSKRVRDKRLQSSSIESCIEDDSDHYYETLSPLGGKRHSTQSTVQPQSQSQSQSRHSSTQNACNELPRRKSELARQPTIKKYNGFEHGLGNTTISDDYDSFDSSIDELCDASQNGLRKDYNDSGVDIRNVKLPEPPQSTNQVYAIVKKLKRFISNKKSPSAASTKLGSQQKLYENTSQFYVEENIYRNTPKSKSLPKLNIRKAPPMPPTAQEDYENAEFHTSTNALLNIDGVSGNSTTKSLSNSEKNLCGANVYQTNPTQSSVATLRSKSKSGKSLKSRIQKTLAGSTYEAKSTTSAAARSTFYIEDPSNCGYGELDSGFSEKASSGDLPTPTPELQKFSTVARKTKKDAKSAQRRRTVIGLRPNDPPPPPPDDAALEKIKLEKSTTSWYAECGVFKNGSTMPAEALDEASPNTSKNTIYNQNGSSAANSSSWYAEAGLYQTSGVSVASSSGSSGVSTGNEAGLGDDLAHSFFMNEPLYQIYNAAKLESISRDMEDNDSSTDGYEEIGQHANVIESNSKREEDRQRRPRLSALQLVGPKAGPARTLWSEIPEVVNSCILLTLTPRERALQEAKFEILTSEASYLKSLNLLRSHFMNHPVFRDTNVVSSRDRKALFSNIVPVHECSERLLTELESCWQDNIMLLGLSKRIYAVAEKYFRVYIDFCEHQGRMDRTLRRLKDSKGVFCQNLDLLESSPTCCGLNLHSFLMLPMQRITRLPLLIDAVFSKVSPNDDEYESWKMTLAIMNKIVAQCNEAANRCEQAYEIERISRQLEFPPSIRALAIAPVGVPAPGSKPRYLVKKGELTHLIWRGDDAKLTFGRKIAKSAIYAFLFSDLLVLAKRNSEEQFTVFDYCPRNMLTITSGNALPQLPTKDLNQTGKNLILMTLLENYEQKTVELVLSCPSVSEQERWLQTMRLPESDTPGEKLYEQWDCPQVIAKHNYKALEPDALDLDVGDVVNVMRKLPDGWYQGERIRDGATGWFPGSFTEEVNSGHVRARNLKQRHRLLTFTATYLELRKQK